MRAPKELFELAKNIQKEARSRFVPPSEGLRPQNQNVIPHAMVRGTRGYIEKVAFQINGCYENGWYDACAVMMRRLMETLIIGFEARNLVHKIKNDKSGDFRYLSDLVNIALAEPSWNLGRSAKQALPRLKQVGDQSAHSRRYVAHREDIDRLLADFRCACQELIFLANLK